MVGVVVGWLVDGGAVVRSKGRRGWEDEESTGSSCKSDTSPSPYRGHALVDGPSLRSIRALAARWCVGVGDIELFSPGQPCRVAPAAAPEAGCPIGS